MHSLQSPDSFEDFVQVLRRSRLVAPEAIETLIERYRTDFPLAERWPDTITAFCNFLVSSGVLTTWQCGKLREGRWRGFFLDNFLLLDRIAQAPEANTYLARRTNGGAFVEVRVFPPNVSPPSKFKYEILRELG